MSTGCAFETALLERVVCLPLRECYCGKSWTLSHGKATLDPVMAAANVLYI